MGQTQMSGKIHEEGEPTEQDLPEHSVDIRIGRELFELGVRAKTQ